MSVITDLQRLEGEDYIGWKIRACLAKKRNETDMNWAEIKDMLGESVTAGHLRRVAVGYEEYDSYINGDIGVTTRVLSISDAHVPFNLPVETFRKYAGRVDVLVFNGDIQDCHSCSSFPRKYRIGFDQEMVETRQYMIDVINMISPKKVIVIMGNHEYRLSRFLSDKLYDDILTIMPDSPQELIVNKGFHLKDRLNKTETWYSPLCEVFSERGIEIEYDGSWYKLVGNVIFAHPLSYSAGMLKTTEKAVNFFLRNNRKFTCICLGHTHKLGFFKQGDILMYEQGCTCDLRKLDYNNGKLVIPGQNGYIYLALDKDGNVIEGKSKLETIN